MLLIAFFCGKALHADIGLKLLPPGVCMRTFWVEPDGRDGFEVYLVIDDQEAGQPVVRFGTYQEAWQWIQAQEGDDIEVY
jgi:hypothetical protein